MFKSDNNYQAWAKGVQSTMRRVVPHVAQEDKRNEYKKKPSSRIEKVKEFSRGSI